MAFNEHAHPLGDILRPELLASLVRHLIPFKKTEPIDFANLPSTSLPEITKKAAWDALIAISKIPLPKMPDMMAFLPDPSEAEFPKQCLGLILLLDQAPRQLLEGIDERWTDPFFGQIAQKLSHAWVALPKEKQPNNWSIWEKEGAHFDYWLFIHFWFSAPFVHSESVADHQIALAMTEARRQAVELKVQEKDPFRAQRNEILSDILAFPRVAMGGSPSGLMQEWVFWSCMLMDTHWPIINKFGRYPYRNAIEGRESTPEESRWSEETNHFAQVSKEVAERVNADKRAGRWTPLGEDKSDM